MIFPTTVFSQASNGHQIHQVQETACSGCGAKVVDWTLHQQFHDRIERQS